MMKCPNCGTTSRIREKDKFCHNCGCSLNAEKAETTKVEDKLDTTIVSVCNAIQNGEIIPGEYADTLKALAALVAASVAYKGTTE